MPSGVRRSTRMDRLLRLTARKYAAVRVPAASSPTHGGPQPRVASPSGGSTLMTSAPRSASTIVAYGPASTVERSITRTPASGPVVVGGAMAGIVALVHCGDDPAASGAAGRLGVPSLPVPRHRTPHRHGLGARPRADLGTLFLATLGRTTGKLRRTALFFVMDGPNYAVVASNAGADHDPAWWRNLQAAPDASIELGRTSTPVRAREATPGERARVWARFVSAAPQYADYEIVAGRPIPVVILEPVVERTAQPPTPAPVG